MLDEQMVAHGVKRVGVQAGRVGMGKPFVQLQVENLKTQRLRRLDFRRRTAPAGRHIASGALTSNRIDSLVKFTAEACSSYMPIMCQTG